MDLLKDRIKPLFYQFLIPAISSAVAVATYSLVDTIAIGQGVGPSGTAACALVLPIFSAAKFVALLCGIGGSVLMSRARGAGNREKGDAYFTAALAVMAFLTTVVWIAGSLLQDPFYRLCGADDVLLPYARAYGSWIFAFLPSFGFSTFLGCFIRSDGSPRIVMFATLLCGVVNMAGDWLLVFPLDMGMAGAAIATALGSVLQTGLLLGYILLKKTSLRLVRPHRWLPAVKKIAATGFSAGIGDIAVIAVSFIANNQIMRYAGGAALAVYGVLGTVSSLFNSLFSGVGQAVQPIASMNYGAGQTERSWKVGKLGLRTTVLLAAVFTLLCSAFPVQITGIFMQMTPEVEAVTPAILRVYALSFLPLAVNVFSDCFLQSMMRPKSATTVSMLRGVVLNCLFLLLFPILWGGSGIWWAISGAEWATVLVSILCISALWRRR